MRASSHGAAKNFVTRYTRTGRHLLCWGRRLRYLCCARRSADPLPCGSADLISHSPLAPLVLDHRRERRLEPAAVECLLIGELPRRYELPEQTHVGLVGEPQLDAMQAILLPHAVVALSTSAVGAPLRERLAFSACRWREHARG